MNYSASDLIRDEDIEKMVVTLRAIAHPTRLQIVNILMSGERSVGELARILCIRQSRTSMQLSILKLRRILKSRGKSNIRFYSFANNSVKNIMTAIISELD